MTSATAFNTAEPPPFGIVVHCHLRWNFVWQRPQHVVSRLAQRVPVLFIEDPLPLPTGETEPRFNTEQITENLIVARPLFEPLTGDAEADAALNQKNSLEGRRLRTEFLQTLGWPNIVHWLYSPMYVSVAPQHSPVGVVYDCMDELANFKFAPADIKDRETQLMELADVVFTGGPSMYAARKDRHRNVHLFNSGVDTRHFAKAQSAETVVPADCANLPKPVLLYYGVIDERMGWENLAAVCDAHSDWSVLMVGPLAKIGEDDLLRRPNLHYTGQRSYDDLPGYLKGCDVAMVPFALSDATLYLSPTKTLEYFAARKPVVSTPIQDIVDHYGDSARIAHTPAEFVRACEMAMAGSYDNQQRIERGAAYADAQTWDSIVDRMFALLSEATESSLI